MDIRRFGPGHRRREGPPGSQGITGQVLHDDARGLIAEVAFERHAVIAPHSNPNTTLFIVVSGGGWVQVGQERSRINHGEAVVWPAGELHGAYTDGTEMRVLMVEFPGADDAWVHGVLDQVGGRIATGPAESAAAIAEGRLAERERTRADHDETEGEPW